MPKQRSLVMATLNLMFFACMMLHAQTGSQAPQPQPTEVRVDNFTFTPGTLTIAANSTVTWTNKDDIPHVIASTDNLFRSKGLDTDDHFSFKFTKPGTYNYFCAIHPKMTGKIVVQ